MMMDDMRYDEMDRVADLKPGGGFDWMRQHSTRFEKMWMSDNLCCPSRATALTGQTPYNNGVYDNSKFVDLHNTLPVWLQNAGYCTAFDGKYLNHYGTGSPRPPGWTYWQPVTSNLDSEHGYAMLNRAGKKVRPRPFITDELGAVSRAQISDCMKTGKPTFATFWPYARHIGSDPAPKYSHVKVPWKPTDPSFNETDVSDKPAWLQKLKPMAPSRTLPPYQRLGSVRYYQQQETTRIQTLFSADDAVKSIIDLVEKRGELSNTIFVPTSDNGWLMGEHRLQSRKDLAYEAAQVSVWIAGPGFPARKAGDGRSVQSLLQEPDLGRTAELARRALPAPVGDRCAHVAIQISEVLGRQRRAL